MYRLFLSLDSDKLNELRKEETIAYYNLKEDSVKAKDELNAIKFQYIYKALIKEDDFQSLIKSIHNSELMEVLSKKTYENKKYKNSDYRLIFFDEKEAESFKVFNIEISLAIPETLKINGLVKYPFHNKLGTVLQLIKTHNISSYMFKVELINAL